SPEGRRLVSGGSDGAVRLWDARSERPLLTLAGHSSAVSCGCFSPDGRRLVSARWDRTLRMWDARTGQHLRTLSGHCVAVLSASFSLDGRGVAAMDSGGELVVWDATSGQRLPSIGVRVRRGDAVSPDGRWFARVDGTQIRLIPLLGAEERPRLLSLSLP